MSDTNSPKERIPSDEEDTQEAPLTMAASVVLTHLPRDASKALENAGDLVVQKGMSLFLSFPFLCFTFIVPHLPLPDNLNFPHPCIPSHHHLSSPNSPTVTIRLQPIGSAPHLTQRIFKLSTTQTFATIVRFLRKRLGVKEHESVFCYVGSVFSPGLDEGVGNLWSCFKQGEELVVGYAVSPAFG
ncbi:Ubiquitin protein [Pyrenophora teres f. teres]|uniref:Ubiquitin-like protein ATG12 n=1 Tax=Pyrenophora teres f. teres TaxID=97479 RepID=A0A6S6VFB5_9PLEO|nr:Ubiquitin protein [Pyrenophora teres f. teres]